MSVVRKGKIHIGTSGWHYKHWVGTFYPDKTKDADQLAYYFSHFNTVELNNSFYHLPLPQTFTNWRKATPPKFLFAVKGSRFITHMKKLNVEKESINIFFRSVSKLKEKLGPILFQLPPKWNVNTERLKLFLKKLPKKYSYSFEFRNPDWYTEEVFSLLKKYNCAFCIYELAGHQSPKEVTADFVYIRLHGPTPAKYAGSYSDIILKEWAALCMQWQNEEKDVYVYFDNDQAGYAAFNAKTLIRFTTGKKK
ncbi:MAG: DUF72 domain-containing protein [Bacteroidetes bacterium]|nr:MAG: DUF72 domain-containing protein [Bacteroidota bacterium]